MLKLFYLTLLFTRGTVQEREAHIGAALRVALAREDHRVLPRTAQQHPELHARQRGDPQDPKIMGDQHRCHGLEEQVH